MKHSPNLNGKTVNIISGILFALIAGSLNGIFALPMKLTKNWAWENVWFPFSFLSLLVFPFLILVLSVPEPLALFISLSAGNISTGLLWGMIVYGGSLLFGISLGYIGIALSFTLLVGSMSIVGIFLPIVLFNTDVLFSYSGALIMLGILFFLVSLFLGFKAGRIKEKSFASSESGSGAKKKQIRTGMLLSVTGGVLSGLLSLGMNLRWAREIINQAVQVGNADLSYASNAVLVIVLAGGLIPNIGYSVYLLSKNKTWSLYKQNRTYWIAILVMGLLYSGSTGLWGISISEDMLGKLGPSVGWALFIGMIVVSSNVTGFLSGEWKGVDSKAIRFNLFSLWMIILALLLIGYGNYMIYLRG